MIEYLPAEPAHAASIAPRLRVADLNETQAATGKPPEAALLASIEASTVAKTIVIDGVPEGLFGVVEVNPLVGVVWAVGTDAVVRLHKRAYRIGTAWLGELHDRWPVLINYIDSRNSVHIRWLQRMGAEFIGIEPEYGFERRPFLLFRHLHNVRTNNHPGRRTRPIGGVGGRVVCGSGPVG